MLSGVNKKKKKRGEVRKRKSRMKKENNWILVFERALNG